MYNGNKVIKQTGFDGQRENSDILYIDKVGPTQNTTGRGGGIFHF